MAMQSLFAFDTLARQAIDPALDAVANENGDNPNYVVSVLPCAPPSRSRSLLTVTNRDPRKARLTATLAIIESKPNAEVRVEQSIATIENGTPRVITTLKRADVTRENIEALARKFADNFFDRVSQQGT
jgi:hypothetical protein